MPATSQLMRSLIEEDADFPVPPAPGEMVVGKVVSLIGNRILVEIDNAFMGLITGREAIDGLGTVKKLDIGSEIKAYVVEDESAEGYFILSLRKAGKEKAWDVLMEKQKTGETIDVSIKEANKGGLMTEVSGIRAFIPVSQLAPEHYPRVTGANSSEILSRLNKLVGQKFTVQILTAIPDENKLILSEKASMDKVRGSALKKLKVGDIVRGKVTGVVNFGIFVMFNDCLEGLVHLSEIAWGRVTDAANYAKIGEDKEAMVIGIDSDKISLSIRRLTPDPWLEITKQFKVGDIVDGTVNKITPYGALVQLQGDVNGLLHTTEINAEETDAESNIKLEIGDKVQAKIIEISPEEHRIALSIKALETKTAKPAKKKTAIKKDSEEKEEPKKEKAEKTEKTAKKTSKKTTKKKEE